MARTCDRVRDHQLRAGLGPGQAVQRHPVEEPVVQPAARQGQVAAEAAVHLRHLRRGRRARRHGARLRVRQGPVRGADARGAQGARAAERPVDRDRGVRPDRAASTRSTSRRPTCSVPTRAARRPTGCCARRWHDAGQRRGGEVLDARPPAARAAARGAGRPDDARALLRRRGARFLRGRPRRRR